MKIKGDYKMVTNILGTNVITQIGIIVNDIDKT